MNKGITMQYGGEQAVKCPKCGEPCTHQTKYTLYCRGEGANGPGPGEDGEPIIMEVNALTGEISFHPGEADSNPSMRRQGMRVHVLCEICGEKSTISFAQHKGATLVSAA